MKNKRKNKKETIKQLAEHFEKDVSKILSIKILPDGGALYKDYVVRQLSNGNWGMYKHTSKDLIEQFYLKTTALMAAKAYYQVKLEKYHEIKHIDRIYWTNYSDSLICKKNLASAKEFDRYLVLLNKLEHSEFKAEHFKEEISKMFKWDFV
jgi:hypothetical protein